jgi:hypothetical protein
MREHEIDQLVAASFRITETWFCTRCSFFSQHIARRDPIAFMSSGNLSRDGGIAA